MAIYYESLCHHGILGQKWGAKNGPPYPLNSSQRSTAERKADTGKTSKKDSAKSSKSTSKTSTTKKISDMTDEELLAKINRARLEQEYKRLTAEQKTTPEWQKFASRVLEKSAEKVATQAATYAMGSAVNKILGEDVINTSGKKKKRSEDDD